MFAVRCSLFAVRCSLFAVLLATFFFPELAQAQSVTYRLTVTEIKPMKLDRCDKMDHYVWLRIGSLDPTWVPGQPMVWTDRINPDLEQEDPNRPGAPLCATYAPHPTPRFQEVDNVSFSRTLPLDVSAVPPVTGRPFPGPSCPQEIPVPPININIELWERDDQIGGNNDDLATEWTSNGQTAPDEGCVDRGDDGGFCWKFEATVNAPASSLPPPADVDGDGLPDVAELHGVDIDCNGIIDPNVDLPLHLMGTTVGVKDMLVELNWFPDHEPQRDTFEAVRNAFARAPETAGGVLTPGSGVNVIFDAGFEFVGQEVHGTFATALLRGGRDLSDPEVAPSTDATGECDNMTHGGRVLPAVDPNVPPTSRDEARVLVCHHDTPSRRGYFRQVVLGPKFEDGVQGIHLENDRMYMLPSDDFGDEGITLMHEIGHSLDLRHGGGSLAEQHAGLVSEENCEPNNFSIMNYMYSSNTTVSLPGINGGTALVPYSGLPFEDAGRPLAHLDFSPPRVPERYDISDGTAGGFIPVQLTPPEGCAVGSCNPNMLFPALDESCLIDRAWMVNNVAEGIFWRHSMIRETPEGVAFLHRVTDPIDWNFDGTLSSECSSQNLNSPSWWATRDTPACQGTDLTVVGGVDEWSIIVIPPSRGVYGESLDIADDYDDFHPDVDIDLTEQFTVDLAVSVHGAPASVQVGHDFELVATVEVGGPGRAYGGYLEVILPEGVAATYVPEGCITRESRHRCTLVKADGVRALGTGDSQEFIFSLQAAPNTTGAPRYILLSASHEGPEVNAEDNTSAIRVIAQPAFLDFEDTVRPWVLTGSNGQTTVPMVSSQVSSGDSAVQFDCGYTRIESPSFDTGELEEVGDTLLFDVFVPPAQNPYWVGSISVYADIPSAQIWNQYLSGVELTPLPRGVWNELSVPVPSALKQALLGDFPDARLRMDINVGGCGAPVGIDSLRFGGELDFRISYHGEPAPPATVVSSSVLTFDQAVDWGSLQVTPGQETANVTEGGGALALASTPWFNVASRRFATTELAGVTDRFSLDVFIPDLPPDYYWFGGLNAFVECPSAGLWKTHLGHQPLQVLFDGEYNRVEFAMPPHAVEVLLGDHLDCRFELEFSTNGLSAPILIDRGGFVQ